MGVQQLVYGLDSVTALNGPLLETMGGSFEQTAIYAYLVTFKGVTATYVSESPCRSSALIFFYSRQIDYPKVWTMFLFTVGGDTTVSSRWFWPHELLLYRDNE